jgi:hypothetical protein
MNPLCYACGEREFATLEAAVAYASTVFDEQGIVLGITIAPPKELTC